MADSPGRLNAQPGRSSRSLGQGRRIPDSLLGGIRGPPPAGRGDLQADRSKRRRRLLRLPPQRPGRPRPGPLGRVRGHRRRPHHLLPTALPGARGRRTPGGLLRARAPRGPDGPGPIPGRSPALDRAARSTPTPLVPAAVCGGRPGRLLTAAGGRPVLLGYLAPPAAGRRSPAALPGPLLAGALFELAWGLRLEPDHPSRRGRLRLPQGETPSDRIPDRPPS